MSSLSTRGNSSTSILVFNSNSGLLAIPTEVRSTAKVGFELQSTREGELTVRCDVPEDVQANVNQTSIPNIVNDIFLMKEKDCPKHLNPKSNSLSIFDPIQEAQSNNKFYGPLLRVSKIRQKDATLLLLKFASFLTKSKGDNSSALIVYRRAVEVKSSNW